MFRNIEFGYKTFYDESLLKSNGYIRLTEYMDVEFVNLKNIDISAEEVNSLMDMKKKIQAETKFKIKDLDRRICELLALPQPTE